ncbi:transcriptional regulator [Flavilitoribacter nigricans DSM 23189 = NBRC 102662]|uniref:Transcriptional regulator n=2 Tax=Flavilitoribacter TaxID=2762562 RepID=A0A2D0MYI6_FLAN2|nr:transcriptional regulator [Flavilitoribacter nigricans DSM 23189 = NBRC 102662]
MAGIVAGSVAIYVIGAILLFILVVLALVDLYKGSYPMNKKLLWLVIILVIPYIGAILYFAVGRNAGRSVT